MQCMEQLYKAIFKVLEGLKTVIAPVHLPIINPPQYTVMYGATCDSSNQML